MPLLRTRILDDKCMPISNIFKSYKSAHYLTSVLWVTVGMLLFLHKIRDTTASKNLDQLKQMALQGTLWLANSYNSILFSVFLTGFLCNKNLYQEKRSYLFVEIVNKKNLCVKSLSKL